MWQVHRPANLLDESHFRTLTLEFYYTSALINNGNLTYSLGEWAYDELRAQARSISKATKSPTRIKGNQPNALRLWYNDLVRRVDRTQIMKPRPTHSLGQLVGSYIARGREETS